MYVARRARNSVESIANRFRLRETCRGVGRTSVFVFARVCVSTYAIARIYVQMRIYLLETWRNFSIDTYRRVLREFKIPLTTSRHSDIRYKSYIDTYVSVQILTYVHAHIFTQTFSLMSIWRRAYFVTVLQPRYPLNQWALADPYGRAMKYWQRIQWLDEEKDGERGRG